MTRSQLQAMRTSIDKSMDEAMGIARRSTNTSNQNINLTVYSIGVVMMKALDAALDVTPEETP